MSVILNETKQAEYIIKKGEVGNKPSSTLFLLAKYYRQKMNLNKEQTFQKLNEFMENNYKNYNSATWEDFMEDISVKATKYPLSETEYVGVTQSELDVIHDVRNIKYEKLLFTMLCYAKLYNMRSEQNNGWVNTKIPEIYRNAKVTVKYSKNKFLYLNDLEQSGLIAFSNKNDNLNLRITFADMNGEPVLKITDFRELGYEYLNHIGDGKFVRCKECGRLVRKTNNKCLYCNSCSKIIEKGNSLIRKRKQRNRMKCHEIKNS